ncbi:unnamed protein product, partial [Allacma fusca]
MIILTTVLAKPTSPVFKEEDVGATLHSNATNLIESNSSDNEEWEFWSVITEKFRRYVNLSHFAANHKLYSFYFAPLCLFN